MDIFRQTKVFYRDRLAFWLTNISIIFILANWAIFLYYKIDSDPNLTVLHYNIYDGIDVLGNYKWIYRIPLIALFISIIDFVLAILLWTTQRTWSYFLLTTILLLNTLVFLYTYTIINYNL